MAVINPATTAGSDSHDSLPQPRSQLQDHEPKFCPRIHLCGRKMTCPEFAPRQALKVTRHNRIFRLGHDASFWIGRDPQT